MTFQNKVVFITGGSRGIGKAIALALAAKGARIAIAAKTDAPHPKLEGTIYETATAIEERGGSALPIKVDVRDEASVEAAIQETVAAFGGIDILINNASAISLTGTLATPMKKFDLMHEVNVRATYMCSQKALPHLLRAANPHILNLAPPINLNPKWFQSHTAYTISKYGMSMCVLGMAAEFQRQGVAVNALWPRTTIATAAVRHMPGGEQLFNQSRNPEIMADAALVILAQPSRSATGQFYLDEDVLRQNGHQDFDRYLVTKGKAPLADFFID